MTSWLSVVPPTHVFWWAAALEASATCTWRGAVVPVRTWVRRPGDPAPCSLGIVTGVAVCRFSFAVRRRLLSCVKFAEFGSCRLPRIHRRWLTAIRRDLSGV